MRYPRLTEQARAPLRRDRLQAGLPPLVAVAHGSTDPRAAATVGELLAAVRARLPGTDIRPAFLGHCAPSLPQVLGALAPDERGACACVTVPLLLSDAYHGKSDLPAQLAAARAARDQPLAVRTAAALGPHPLLLAAAERRLREAGTATGDARGRAGTSVVLAAAGSSDPAARAAVTALAARWARARGWHSVLPAFASAAGPRPAEAVRAARDAGAARVVVATYLLAPGHFADKIRAAALGAGADAVSGVLGAAPEVADAVVERYADAVLNAGEEAA